MKRQFKHRILTVCNEKCNEKKSEPTLKMQSASILFESPAILGLMAGTISPAHIGKRIVREFTLD